MIPGGHDSWDRNIRSSIQKITSGLNPDDPQMCVVVCIYANLFAW